MRSTLCDSGSRFALVDMEAGATSLEPRESSVRSGPFEKMCKMGLPFPDYPVRREDDKQLLGDMTRSKSSTFLPLHHVIPAFMRLLSMNRCLFTKSSVTPAYLLTGSTGIGKSHLMRSFGAQMTARNALPGDGRITLYCHIKLGDHVSSETASFHEWLLRSAAIELRTLGRHGSVVDALEVLADTAREAPSNIVNVQQLLLHAPLEGTAGSAAPKVLSPEVQKTLQDAGTGHRLELASAVLKQAQIAVIAHVDEAEHFFQGDHFTYECAKRWTLQLRGLLSSSSSAVGLVLCTTFQRAGQLFLSDERPHHFPGVFTHRTLRRNWGRHKLNEIRVGDPAWDSESITAFLLTHACREVDVSFSLYQRRADELPSAAALAMARKLDALYGSGWEGSDGLCGRERRVAFLEHVMERYGHTPKKLALAATNYLAQWDPTDPWPFPSTEMAKPGQAEGGQRLEQVVGTFMGLFSDEKRKELAEVTRLDFHFTDFIVPKGLFEQALEWHLSRLPPSTAAAAGDGTIPAEAALTTPSVTQSIDAAVDAGWLVDHGRWWGLGCLDVYRQFMRRSVLH